MAGARHGMCELRARHGRGAAWQGRGMGTTWARYAMCESAFSDLPNQLIRQTLGANVSRTRADECRLVSNGC
jgi:hypothetical protein